jgi:hypothetical protein
VIVLGGWGGAVAISGQYRFVAVLFAILLLAILTARGARLLWQGERDRADAAEDAFEPGALTAAGGLTVERVNTLIVNLPPGAPIPPIATGSAELGSASELNPPAPSSESEHPEQSDPPAGSA